MRRKLLRNARFIQDLGGGLAWDLVGAGFEWRGWKEGVDIEDRTRTPEKKIPRASAPTTQRRTAQNAVRLVELTSGLKWSVVSKE